MHRLGILWSVGPDDPGYIRRGELLEALAKLGYVTGRNLEIVERHANGRPDQLPGLAVQLVGLGVDAILTQGTPATLAAQRATQTIPIVTSVADPVASGFARELRRPGGNITGISQNRAELARKQVELLRILVPGASTIGVTLDAASPSARVMLPSFKAAAGEASMATWVEAVTPGGLDRALEEFRRRGIRIAADLGTGTTEEQAAKAAIRHGIAMIAGTSWGVEAGLLACVDVGSGDFYVRTAALLDKIFRGANPAELPFELASRFQLVINAKTASALGIRLTPELRLRADRVFE